VVKIELQLSKEEEAIGSSRPLYKDQGKLVHQEVMLITWYPTDVSRESRFQLWALNYTTYNFSIFSLLKQ